jgi:hypothetical protein
MSNYCTCCASDAAYVQAHLLGQGSITDYAAELYDIDVALAIIDVWAQAGEPVTMPVRELARCVRILRAREEAQAQ